MKLKDLYEVTIKYEDIALYIDNEFVGSIEGNKDWTHVADWVKDSEVEAITITSTSRIGAYIRGKKK